MRFNLYSYLEDSNRLHPLNHKMEQDTKATTEAVPGPKLAVFYQSCIYVKPLSIKTSKFFIMQL